MRRYQILSRKQLLPVAFCRTTSRYHSTVAFRATLRHLCATTGSPGKPVNSSPTTTCEVNPSLIDASDIPQWLSDLQVEYVTKIKNSTDAKSNTYDIRLFDPSSWVTTPFTFHQEAWNPNEMTSVQKRRLCLGDEAKTYTLIGEAFSFPTAEDHPIIHESNSTAKIWWDNGSKTPKILVQLSEYFPPLLWLGVVPRLDAVRKMFEEFLQIDSRCMQKNLSEAEKSHEKFFEQLGADSSTIAEKKHQLKDLYLNELRQTSPESFGVDWENDVCLYTGSHENMATLERKWMRNNPFVFGWPLLISDGNSHMENRPVQLAAFRTLMSKSIILMTNRRDLQVHPQGIAGSTSSTQTDSIADELTMETPVFLFINYPRNTRLSGGEAFVRRFNSLMGTDLPTDLPVDVLATLCRESITKTTSQILAETNFLDTSVRNGGEKERHPRLASLLHSSTRAVGQLAYNIMYLGCMQCSDWDAVFAKFAKHPEATVRIGVAKGSAVLQRLDLVKALVDQETDVEVKASLSKLVEGV